MAANSSVLCRPLLAAFLVALSQLVHARDTISSSQPLQAGDTLVSAGSVFVLGFFSPINGTSSEKYLGIWYNFSTSTVLWVANRESPVTGAASVVIGSDGNLVILDGDGSIRWSSNASVGSSNSSAQLLDTGNLVVNSSGGTAWQSFDNPTDTYMTGMKAGLDLRTGANQKLTSWTSDGDPSPGRFSLGMDPTASTEIFIWEGSKPRWRSGRWNDQVFIGIQGMVAQYLYGFKLNNFLQEHKMYFYISFNRSHRYVLTWDGVVRHMIWMNDTSAWFQYWAQPLTACDFYNRCGKYASCTDGAATTCSCLRGFVPVSSEEWSNGNWSSGCRRMSALGCAGTDGASGAGGGDKFERLEGVKLPDLSDWNSDITDVDACRDTCLKNCSCTAYAYVSGIRCLLWGVDLVDVQTFSSGGEDLYFRLASSELDDRKIKTSILIVIVIVPVAFILGCTLLFWKCRRRSRGIFIWPLKKEISRNSSRRTEIEANGLVLTRTRDESHKKLSELQLWSFDSVLTATNEFSDSNLIGKGGFGPVYKGVSTEWGEVAVKRLSRNSLQGIDEFKNEVILISKLQHRNLVKLMGCCIHGEESILIYEYMPNGSLDAFIFDPVKKGLLDWTARHNIIQRIARGLLYLHRDSRLRIIHRDLKVSNILLDEFMNPKISDFGMARIFRNEDEANTQRVVGTFGYMSPEYAMHGVFSMKSDVYSFGVLILEIVSGNKNNTYGHPESATNLISFAWKMWKEEKLLEFIDPILEKSCLKSQLDRCMSLALLCLQDNPNDRPDMASAITLLETDSSSYALPKQPIFTTDTSFTETDSTSFLAGRASPNSITMFSGR